MDQAQRVKEFNEKYQALVREYQIEIRPQIGINLFDLAPVETVAEKVPTQEVPSESPKEAEIEETPKNEA